jgi:nucleotide-binding universal stress UspA family protein
MKENPPAGLPFVKSVLHPTDFSEASERAFAHALAIALLRQTEFTILHVDPDKPDDVEWNRFPGVRKTLERWGLLGKDSPRSAVYEELKVSVRKLTMKSRHPVLATARYAADHDVDLLVLATEGREGLSRWLDRCDAEAMARWTRTMTLFVPADAARDIVALDDGDLTLRNVLVPVDTKPDPAAAIEFARRAAEVMGDGDVTITLLHVGDAALPTPALVEGDGWTWRHEQRKGDPVDEIVTAADALAADLIVMTTAGHEGLVDALRGSTTEKVTRRAPCPLLAVPAGAFGDV